MKLLVWRRVWSRIGLTKAFADWIQFCLFWLPANWACWCYYKACRVNSSVMPLSSVDAICVLDRWSRRSSFRTLSHYYSLATYQRPWICHATLSSQMCIAAGLGGSLKCHMEIIPSFSATQTWQSWGHHIIRIFIIDAGGSTYIWHMDVVYVKWVKCQQGLRSGQNVVPPLQDMAWLELFPPSAGTSWFGPFPPPLVPCLSSPFMVFCVDRLRHITRQLQWYEVKNLAVCCPKFQKAKDIMTAGSSVPLQPAWI